MVNDFLKKYQNELISEKSELKEDLDSLQLKINEENKFLNVLEESNETYFKEFTPRDLNAKNNKKAAEVREILINLNSEFQTKSKQMKFYDGRLDEINNLLNNDFIVDDNLNEHIDNVDSNIDDTLSYKDNLKKSLNEIKKLIVLDPYRAQFELEKIISSI